MSVSAPWPGLQRRYSGSDARQPACPDHLRTGSALPYALGWGLIPNWWRSGVEVDDYGTPSQAQYPGGERLSGRALSAVAP